ncbi:MAG: nucleoside triphosphate pyrophosphohydrolase family protein [Candidatus Pacebacteria bacterium]|nr:nucleoside triphosphate pyrophosphohydrolase family protein [Candidatus Paceibacterota bacterium]
MDSFKEYEKTVTENVIGGGKTNIAYPALALCGEAGEVAEKIKKIIRDNDGVMTDDHKAELVKELGDVLFYLAYACCTYGLSLHDVANKNIEKVLSRRDRGVVHGDGDNR